MSTPNLIAAFGRYSYKRPMGCRPRSLDPVDAELLRLGLLSKEDPERIAAEASLSVICAAMINEWLA